MTFLTKNTRPLNTRGSLQPSRPIKHQQTTWMKLLVATRETQGIFCCAKTAAGTDSDKANTTPFYF